MDVLEYLKSVKGIDLHDQQREAVFQYRGKTLLLAVPGSGKTTVLAARLFHLIGDQGVDPRQCLTITFSREAARDMQARYEELFGAAGGGIPRFSTIHSFCYQVLREYAKAYRRPLPKLLEGNGSGERRRLLGQIAREELRRFLTDEEQEQLENRISYRKNALLPPKPGEEEKIPGFARIFTAYEQIKKDHGWMDFDDLAPYASSILKNCRGLFRAVSERCRHISLDEAQDTSRAQQRFLDLLIPGCDSYFAVGDEDQSIYGFRGASPDYLLGFSDYYPDGQVLKLEQNFRSGPSIIRRASQFIQAGSQGIRKEMTCPNRPEDSPLERKPLRDYEDQRQAVTEFFRRHPGETMAVLYRNHDSGVWLGDYLLRQGVPFALKDGGASFFRSSVVRDIFAFFRLSLDQKDVDALEMVAYKLYLSRGMIRYVREEIGRFDTVWEALLSMEELRDYSRQKIRYYARTIPELKRKSPLQGIRTIEINLGYEEYLASKKEEMGLPFLRLNVLRGIAESCRTMFDFFDRMEELPTLLRRAGECGKTSLLLSTVHGVKGLEFDNVAVLDLIDGIFPAEQDENLGEEPEEEARLFYVAVTRAKKRVFLTESRRLNGRDVQPSPFLDRFLPR